MVKDKIVATKKYETKNYDKFNFIASNRMIQSAHVNHIMEEIQRNDLRKENPIKISKKFEILEGQHTFLACKELGLSIFYEFSNMSIQDIGAYNSVQKSWSYKDTLNHYCVEGFEDYMALYQLVQEYPYPITTFIILLSGENTKAVLKEFKQGRFKIKQSVKKVIEILDKIRDYQGYDNFIFRHKTFLLTYIDLLTHPKFSHKTMLHKVSLVPEKFVKQTTQQDYLRMLEEIYNFLLCYKYL